MTLSTESLLPVALEAVALGVEIFQSRAPGKLTAKGDRDMATEVDYLVERTVREYLLRKTPGIAFLGEEEGEHGESSGCTWMLDPVDGTANFAHDIPLCALSLSLVEEATATLGIIVMPLLGRTYTAVRGSGAIKNGRPIHVRDTSSLSESIVSIGDYAVGINAESENELRLALTHALVTKAQRIRMIGSAATDLTWVAEGLFDACVILSNKPWDTSAGVLIAREAGAQVLDVDGTQHDCGSSATIAAAPGVAQEIIELVRSLPTS